MTGRRKKPIAASDLRITPAMTKDELLKELRKAQRSMAMLESEFETARQKLVASTVEARKDTELIRAQGDVAERDEQIAALLIDKERGSSSGGRRLVRLWLHPGPGSQAPYGKLTLDLILNEQGHYDERIPTGGWEMDDEGALHPFQLSSSRMDYGAESEYRGVLLGLKNRTFEIGSVIPLFEDGEFDSDSPDVFVVKMVTPLIEERRA